jgi:hypothetical protein
MSLPTNFFIGRGALLVPSGEALFDNSRSNSWTVPSGVSLISAVLVGGGAGADGSNCGGGGALGWINDLPVTAGTTLTIQAGRTGSRFGSGVNGAGGSDTDGQSSVIYAPDGSLMIYAEGGSKGSANNGGYWGNGSSYVNSAYSSLTRGGGNGGHGGNGNGNQKGGGGGAGGYSGNGGNGGAYGNNQGASGQGGGGGGGGGANTNDGGQGGGVGVFGEGASGLGGSAASYGNPGTGGSGGGTGAQMYGYWTTTTGAYGGGSGAGSGGGGRGAVRIIWGEGRAFPATNTAQSFSQDIYLNGVLQP